MQINVQLLKWILRISVISGTYTSLESELGQSWRCKNGETKPIVVEPKPQAPVEDPLLNKDNASRRDEERKKTSDEKGRRREVVEGSHELQRGKHENCVCMGLIFTIGPMILRQVSIMHEQDIVRTWLRVVRVLVRTWWTTNKASSCTNKVHLIHEQGLFAHGLMHELCSLFVFAQALTKGKNHKSNLF